MAINPTALANINAALMPNQVTGPIFAKATQASAVMSLSRKVPLAMNATTAIPVSMDMPIPDWVGEGGVKPASQTGVGVKIMNGKKLALIVPISSEVVATNPAGVVDQLKTDLPSGMARAFDFAAINGKSLRTGAAGPFTDFLANCSSTVALGTTTQANGGIYGDLVAGEGAVVNKNFDFTGIAADPRLRVDAKAATDIQGRPLLVDAHSTGVNNQVTLQELAGYPVAFNQGVSGRYWRGGDSTQLVTINGTPSGGTFVLASGGNSTTLAWNAAAATTVQSAIQAWGGIYATVTVTGSAGGPYTVVFPAISTGVLAESAPFTVDQRLLTGGTSATAKATVAASGATGTDSLLRGIGGDWSQAAYGIGMDITVKSSDQASYFDGTNWHSAFQENLELLLVEAYFGFVMGSNDAFVAYTKGSATF